MENACMHAAKKFIKHRKFRYLAYMYFECLHCSSEVCSRCQGKIENVKVIAPLHNCINSITTDSDLQIFAISLTL